MASAADLQSFVPALRGVVESLKVSTELTSLIWRLRIRLRTIYEGNLFQLFVAVMIFANFGSNVAQTQLNPQDGTPPASVLYAIDLTLTILFTAELIMNFMSSDIRPFLRDGWNWLDTAVVATSLAAYCAEGVQGLAQLRLARILRVLRVCRTVAPLRKIVSAIRDSLPAVGNAFLLTLLVTSLYSILGALYLAPLWPPDGPGPNPFGSFAAAMFAMWQFLT
eukprot:CAMPEP_0172179788 /NCGR_PEP_ID=MMETSP1050-20130122/16825_1 /TAXON_ID=233186 /ORGANISM="Cryptomonas curvata, Strain CCAP979/52" /LENGTH=221 /DNA_ID=CAMNT_0012852735 /DNA_START=327 /DNA_END=988 /DNA_ORIENTATION=-